MAQSGYEAMEEAWRDVLLHWGSEPLGDDPDRALRTVPLSVNGRLRSTLGRWSPKDQTIEIATWLLDTGDAEQIADTVTHEAAHALAGQADGWHGPTWQAWYRKLGGSGEAKCGERSVVAHAPTVKDGPKYRLTCRDCGDVVGTRKRLAASWKRKLRLGYLRSGCCRAGIHVTVLR